MLKKFTGTVLHTAMVEVVCAGARNRGGRDPLDNKVLRLRLGKRQKSCCLDYDWKFRRLGLFDTNSQKLVSKWQHRLNDT
jgi:hypothetical protein